MKEEEKTEPSKMGGAVREILSTILSIAIIFVLCFLITQYIGQRTKVVGSSMESTLSDGDQLIVDKISYRFTEPQRYDIIIFPFRLEENTYYIKRIIGMPGETIQIDHEGNIYVDGQVLEEEYGLDTIRDPGIAMDPITLTDDEYFVMGDNRNNSTDSRYPEVGPIHRREIIGRAWVRIFPFRKAAFIKHR